MLKKLLLFVMVLFVATPSFAQETPSVSYHASSVERMATAKMIELDLNKQGIVGELPEFNKPDFGDFGIQAARHAQDATAGYESARGLFKTGRILGLLSIPVAIVGFIVGITAAAAGAAGGSGAGVGAGVGLILITALASNLMFLGGYALGQIGWMNGAKWAQMKKPPGPSKGLGYVSLALGAIGIIMGFVPGVGNYGGLLVLGSYICAELQNSSTHRYWMSSAAGGMRHGAERKGLNIKMKLVPNGLVGRF